MLIKQPSDIAPSEITPKRVFEHRRLIIKAAGLGAAGAAIGSSALARSPDSPGGRVFPDLQKSPLSALEKANSLTEITSYCNFVEFGPDKVDPPRLAHLLKTRPWTVSVEGLVAKPKVFAIEDLYRLAPLEERIYRLRCVEAWSMVIPWVGFPLERLIRQVEPLGAAKFVEFYTHYDPATMPGTRLPYLDWPYMEGLRLDEAIHPLTLLAVGLYGQELPNQNGAPLRLVVPWKYGFKSGKSIVRIRFVEKQPQTTWMRAVPDEYGFYANVNPDVEHPRWSQSSERRIGEFFRRKTQMFNGYASQVAGLYAGMDLRRNF